MTDIAQLTESVDTLKVSFEDHRYICSNQIATAVYLAFHLRKPVLIEGPPGVGKTELAKTTSELFALPSSVCNATRAWMRPRPFTSGSTASSFSTRRC